MVRANRSKLVRATEDSGGGLGGRRVAWAGLGMDLDAMARSLETLGITGIEDKLQADR